MQGSRGPARRAARWHAATHAGVRVRAVGVALPAATLSGCGGVENLGAMAAVSVGLLIAVAAGAAIGWLVATQRHRGALHDARQHARLVAAMASSPVWRTDAGQRVVSGPPDADGRAWTDLVDGADADTRLASPVEIQATVVRRRADGALCELRARPCFDAAGAFDGHIGMLTPLAADPLSAAAAEVLGAAAGGPLWVAVRPAADWLLWVANAPARDVLGGSAAAVGGPLDVARMTASLPATLRQAWDEGAPGAEAEGWHLQRREGPPAVVVVWRRSGDDAGVDADESASLAYSVSHDLRAPIRVVEGFARIVKEDYSDALDRVAADHLERILGAAARMNQMIDAMLTLARLSTQPLARQPVDLSQLAGYVIDELRRGAPERRVEVEVDPGLRVHGDPTLLRLVLENLLGNAWKYTAQRAPARIVFARERQDGRPVFVVRDNGAGFDMRSADRLFGLFQRLHSASDFPGTGVGLASVRRIVQRHGGQIWADAEPGRGAAFHFTLRD